MTLLKREEVRDIYEKLDEQPSRHIDLQYETQHYIIDGRGVLDKKTRALVGTLFDDAELEKVIEATKISEREVDLVLSQMFLGYIIPNQIRGEK